MYNLPPLLPTTFTLELTVCICYKSEINSLMWNKLITVHTYVVYSNLQYKKSPVLLYDSRLSYIYLINNLIIVYSAGVLVIAAIGWFAYHQLHRACAEVSKIWWLTFKLVWTRCRFTHRSNNDTLQQRHDNVAWCWYRKRTLYCNFHSYAFAGGVTTIF